MSEQVYSLERIADRMEIQDRLYQFARGVDRRDWQLALSVYHDDAVDRHGVFNGPAAEFIEFLKQRHGSVVRSMHRINNVIIEFTASGDALVESYGLTWQALSQDSTDVRVASDRKDGTGDSRPMEMISLARYVDLFRKKNGTWRIQDRQIVYESSMKILPDSLGADMSAVMEMSRRDEEDYLVKMRRNLLGI